VAIDYTDVQALATEFSGLTQGQIDPWLERAARRMNADYWGDLYDDGHLMLTAHLLAQTVGGTNGGGASGPVVSKSVGSMSVTYGSYLAGAKVPAQYVGTIWGREYWALVRSLGPSAQVV
jgi:hypothetical protein